MNFSFKWMFALLAFFFALNTASAGFYAGTYGSNYYVEVNYGNNYVFAEHPYTFAYDNHYYFDSSYRVYSSGNYSYFQPGWYSYEPTWRFAPDNIAYYNYYPSSYYYFDSKYYYAPYFDWRTYYAPIYGNYYYPFYSIYGGTPTLTGQQFQPKQEAFCAQAEISGQNISLNAGETKKVVFSLSNESKKFADIENVSVTIDGFNVQAKNLKFDKVVKDWKTDKIEFEISALPQAQTETFTGTVKAYLTFRDGTYCSSSDLQENFTVSVLGASAPTQQASNYSYPQTVTTGSVAYRVYNPVEAQQWQNAEPQTGSQGNYNYNSNPGQTGNFQGYNSQGAQNYQNYNSTNSNVVETYYGEKQLIESDCSGLSIAAKDFAVGSGKSNSKYFNFRNYSSEDFWIDSMQAVEGTEGFAVDVSNRAGIIYSGQTGSLKVKVNANETAKDVKGTAYVKVKGHFNSGLPCTAASENFYIRVDGFAPAGEFYFTAPDFVEMKATSQLLEISFENLSEDYAEIEIGSKNISVTPKNFTIKPKTSGSRLLALNGFNGSEDAIVYFTIETENGSKIKYTKLAKAANFEALNSVQSPGQQGGSGTVETGNEGNGNNSAGSVGAGIQGIVSTGFAILGENSFLLGFAAILLLLAFFITQFRNQ